MMKIIFYDVEHGSCCHIITPKQQHILVDIGSKANASVAKHIRYKYFPFYSDRTTRKIAQLLVTHPHEDHIYDLPRLHCDFTIEHFWRPTGAFDISPPPCASLYSKTVAECANNMNKYYRNSLNPIALNRESNGGVNFELITPSLFWTNKNDLNTFSPIIVVTYCQKKFVLTGDNPCSILQKMIDQEHCDIKNKVKNATVLLAPHHGRVKEYCSDFFKCVNPTFTVVSDKSIIHETQRNTSSLYEGNGGYIDRVWRHTLTTRKDGSIMFEVAPGSMNAYLGLEKY